MDKKLILAYLRKTNSNAKYSHLIKLGCTKRQAAEIKTLLENIDVIDLYKYDSKICTYLHIDKK